MHFADWLTRMLHHSHKKRDSLEANNSLLFRVPVNDFTSTHTSIGAQNFKHGGIFRLD